MKYKCTLLNVLQNECSYTFNELIKFTGKINHNLSDEISLFEKYYIISLYLEKYDIKIIYNADGFWSILKNDIKIKDSDFNEKNTQIALMQSIIYTFKNIHSL